MTTPQNNRPDRPGPGITTTALVIDNIQDNSGMLPSIIKGSYKYMYIECTHPITVW